MSTKPTRRQPSPNGDNGQRDAQGRFLAGNAGGPGNPHAASVGLWRKALIDAVSPADLDGVLKALIEKAKAGEGWAVRELLDRCLGRPKQMTELQIDPAHTWAGMVALLRDTEDPDEGSNA